MKRTSIFLMLVCCLFSNISFAQDLNQKINYSASNKNLEQILNDLGDSYDVSFSYMNNELPSTRMDVEFEGITID